MAPRRRRLPSFYKILLDRSAPHLALPDGFVRKHLENNIPDNPIVRSVNGGYSWNLKIKKEGEVYCFADGWNDVVEDSELEFGDFLVFWLVDQSTFKLSIFSPNGCEKDFPPKIQVENDDQVKEEEAEKVEEEEEEEDDEEDEEEIAEEEDDEEEEEEEEEESDEEEEEEEDDDNCDEVEYDADEDEDGGGDIDGDDGDPFFMRIISTDHKFALRFPMEFTELAGIDKERSITMKNLDGKEWPIKMLSEGTSYTRYYLSSGWSEFRQVNQLADGDKCVFKFIRSEDKFCLAKHTKKRAPVKHPPVKRTRELPLLPPHVETESKENDQVEEEEEEEEEETEKVGRKRKRAPARQPAGRVPAAEVLRRCSRRQPPPRVVVVKEKVRAKQPAEKAPVAEVSRRLRGRKPRVEVVEKKVRSKRTAGKALAAKVAAEVSKRLRARPPRVELVEKKARSKRPAEVSKRPRGRPSRVEVVEKKAPAAEGLKRKRGRQSRPSRVEVVENKAPAAEGLKRKRGRQSRPSRVEVMENKAPAAEGLKRKRGRQSRPSNVEVESKDDGAMVVKRARGRPFKRKRGRGPAAHVK